ncbi:MAG: YHYH protein [Flavobacteriales bacterium]|nr:YHYH protein [Flavobacteriales bacterium]
MRYASLFTSFGIAVLVSAQGPVVTSWIINPGNQTGYGGYLTNAQSVWYTNTDAYVVCTCIPGYDIGPWAGNPNTPANQDFTFKITRAPVENTGTDVATGLGHIGAWRNGVSIFNAKDGMSYNNQGVWNRDALVWEGSSFDACLGHPAPNGEYHHHVNPACLYDYMDDQQHADLIGYAFDGFPIYGAFAYANADGTGGIVRMHTSYQLRVISDRTTLPNGTVLNASQYGPAIGGQYALGAYIEDYEYVVGLGDLDEHNGRWCITPEYPSGTYAYFVTVDEQLDPVFPYVIGPTYYGTVQGGNTGPGSGHNPIPGTAIEYNTAVGLSGNETVGISISPIPVNDRLRITSNASSIELLELMNVSGQVVLSHGVQGSMVEIDMAAQAAGIYLLRLSLADGSHVHRSVLKD